MSDGIDGKVRPPWPGNQCGCATPKRVYDDQKEWAEVVKLFDHVQDGGKLTVKRIAFDNSDFEAMVAEEYDLWTRKGDEYRNGGDRLANFNRIAERLELTPLKVWSVYVTKHWDAIHEYIRTGREGAEGIESRLADLAVYAKLGRLLVRQQKGVKA